MKFNDFLTQFFDLFRKKRPVNSNFYIMKDRMKKKPLKNATKHFVNKFHYFYDKKNLLRPLKRVKKISFRKQGDSIKQFLNIKNGIKHRMNGCNPITENFFEFTAKLSKEFLIDELNKNRNDKKSHIFNANEQKINLITNNERLFFFQFDNFWKCFKNEKIKTSTQNLFPFSQWNFQYFDLRALTKKYKLNTEDEIFFCTFNKINFFGTRNLSFMYVLFLPSKILILGGILSLLIFFQHDFIYSTISFLDDFKNKLEMPTPLTILILQTHFILSFQITFYEHMTYFNFQPQINLLTMHINSLVSNSFYNNYLFYYVFCRSEKLMYWFINYNEFLYSLNHSNLNKFNLIYYQKFLIAGIYDWLSFFVTGYNSFYMEVTVNSFSQSEYLKLSTRLAAIIPINIIYNIGELIIIEYPLKIFENFFSPTDYYVFELPFTKNIRYYTLWVATFFFKYELSIFDFDIFLTRIPSLIGMTIEKFDVLFTLSSTTKQQSSLQIFFDNIYSTGQIEKQFQFFSNFYNFILIIRSQLFYELLLANLRIDYNQLFFMINFLAIYYQSTFLTFLYEIFSLYELLFFFDFVNKIETHTYIYISENYKKIYSFFIFFYLDGTIFSFLENLSFNNFLENRRILLDFLFFYEKTRFDPISEPDTRKFLFMVSTPKFVFFFNEYFFMKEKSPLTLSNLEFSMNYVYLEQCEKIFYMKNFLTHIKLTTSLQNLILFNHFYFNAPTFLHKFEEPWELGDIGKHSLLFSLFTTLVYFSKITSNYLFMLDNFYILPGVWNWICIVYNLDFIIFIFIFILIFILPIFLFVFYRTWNDDIWSNLSWLLYSPDEDKFRRYKPSPFLTNFFTEKNDNGKSKSNTKIFDNYYKYLDESKGFDNDDFSATYMLKNEDLIEEIEELEDLDTFVETGLEEEEQFILEDKLILTSDRETAYTDFLNKFFLSNGFLTYSNIDNLRWNRLFSKFSASYLNTGKIFLHQTILREYGIFFHFFGLYFLGSYRSRFLLFNIKLFGLLILSIALFLFEHSSSLNNYPIFFEIFSSTANIYVFFFVLSILPILNLFFFSYKVLVTEIKYNFLLSNKFFFWIFILFKITQEIGYSKYYTRELMITSSKMIYSRLLEFLLANQFLNSKQHFLNSNLNFLMWNSSNFANYFSINFIENFFFNKIFKINKWFTLNTTTEIMKTPYTTLYNQYLNTNLEKPKLILFSTNLETNRNYDSNRWKQTRSKCNDFDNISPNDFNFWQISDKKQNELYIMFQKNLILWKTDANKNLVLPEADFFYNFKPATHVLDYEWCYTLNFLNNSIWEFQNFFFEKTSNVQTLNFKLYEIKYLDLLNIKKSEIDKLKIDLIFKWLPKNFFLNYMISHKYNFVNSNFFTSSFELNNQYSLADYQPVNSLNYYSNNIAILEQMDTGHFDFYEFNSAFEPSTVDNDQEWDELRFQIFNVQEFDSPNDELAGLRGGEFNNDAFYDKTLMKNQWIQDYEQEPKSNNGSNFNWTNTDTWDFERKSIYNFIPRWRSMRSNRKILRNRAFQLYQRYRFLKMLRGQKNRKFLRSKYRSIQHNLLLYSNTNNFVTYDKKHIGTQGIGTNLTWLPLNKTYLTYRKSKYLKSQRKLFGNFIKRIGPLSPGLFKTFLLKSPYFVSHLATKTVIHSPYHFWPSSIKSPNFYEYYLKNRNAVGKKNFGILYHLGNDFWNKQRRLELFDLFLMTRRFKLLGTEIFYYDSDRLKNMGEKILTLPSNSILSWLIKNFKLKHYHHSDDHQDILLNVFDFIKKQFTETEFATILRETEEYYQKLQKEEEYKKITKKLFFEIAYAGEQTEEDEEDEINPADPIYLDLFIENENEFELSGAQNDTNILFRKSFYCASQRYDRNEFTLNSEDKNLFLKSYVDQNSLRRLDFTLCNTELYSLNTNSTNKKLKSKNTFFSTF